VSPRPGGETSGLGAEGGGFLDGEVGVEGGEAGEQPLPGAEPEVRDVGWNAEWKGALIAFLSAGTASEPATAQLVSALAAARRAVAGNRSEGRPLTQWLEDETRLRGIRENAAVLAVMEVPEMRETVARDYRQEHPDRGNVLNEILAYL
jgi:hypothetical protein